MNKVWGVVRKFDHLGRLVIPKEVRDACGMTEGSVVEILGVGDGVYVRRYRPGCVFCGKNVVNPTVVLGKELCEGCFSRLIGEFK